MHICAHTLKPAQEAFLLLYTYQACTLIKPAHLRWVPGGAELVDLVVTPASHLPQDACMAAVVAFKQALRSRDLRNALQLQQRVHRERDGGVWTPSSANPML